MTQKPQYQCFYCSKAVSLEDLLKVEAELTKLDPEDHEFTLDQLPKSTNPRETPFIHPSNLGYDTLNICPQCLNKAFNKATQS